MQPDSAGLFTRSTAVAAGYTDHELARRCRSGELRKVATGLYVTTTHFDSLDDAGKHSLRARAAARLRRGAVISHTSAAAAHRLDLWNADLSQVHLTIPVTTGGEKSPDRHIHSCPNVPAVQVDGAPTTPVARTVVDCGRILNFENAVVIGDSALAKGIVTPMELSSALESRGGSSGIAAARRAVSFLDGRSESPGETLSRIRFHEFGMPLPTLQHVLSELRFRVDFYWEKYRIVGEFDGRTKYGGSGEALHREKFREDAIRDRGYEVIRWIWSDLFHFDRVVERFGRAVDRANRRR